MSVQTNIIWLDQNIFSEAFQIINELLELGFTKAKLIFNTFKAIEELKKIKFEDTIIIADLNIYSQFIKEFNKNITNIYTIPIIIIFNKPNKENDLNLKQNNIIENDPYYTYGGIKTSFDEIKNYIMNPKNKDISSQIIDDGNFVFEYIDSKEKLVLPLLFKCLIESTTRDKINEFTKLIYNKYSNNKPIKMLLNNIQSIPNIPIELLSKYYSRIYTIESNFYKDLNKDLRNNKKDIYLPFIKVLYDGVKLCSLSLASNNTLYRGSLISNIEINLLKKYLKNKIAGLPGAIVFSKVFLSFTKVKVIAEKFLNSVKKNDNLSKVLFILEKDANLDYSLSTHSDLEKVSFYPDEKEVLFFPFSSFEIKEINKIENINENKYIIHLLYLGKYIKEFKEENILTNNDIIIPNSEFKKEIINSGLIKKDTEKKGIKKLLKEYKSYKLKIDFLYNNLEHEFTFFNLKEIDSIDNKSKIDNLIVLDKKYIFVRSNNGSTEEINIYSIETKSLILKIPLKGKEENERWLFINKGLEIYMKDEKEINLKKILLISDIYLIEINLVNYYYKFVKILSKGQFLSNLDIIEIDDKVFTSIPYAPFKTFNSQDKGIVNVYDYEGNLKVKMNLIFVPRKKYEINGKFLITYSYNRGLSTTTIIDMRNNYKKVLEKSYLHFDIYGFPDKDTIILPPNPSTELGDEKIHGKFIVFDLNTFEVKYLSLYVFEYDHFYAPKLTHKLNDEKYLFYKAKKWKIVKYNGESFENIEELNDENILGENIYFLNQNRIITYNFGESQIKFLKY